MNEYYCFRQSDAIRAIQSMDGQIINGRSMQVSQSIDYYVCFWLILLCLKVYQAHVKQKSLLKSYFLIQSLDRSLFGGCYCCKPNSVNRINYGQTYPYE